MSASNIKMCCFHYDTGQIMIEFDSDDEDEEQQNIGTLIQMDFVSKIPSLQHICLQTIEGNLIRFSEAVSTTIDANFRMNLHYLRQVHTPFFLNNKLKEENSINKAYWNLLLNEYLEELNLNSIQVKDQDDLIMKLDEIGHAIEKIRFDLSKTEDSKKDVVFVKNVLLKLQNLKILHLHSFVDDTVLNMLPSCCAKLEELRIPNCAVTEKGLKSLCQKEKNGGETPSLNLRVIDLSGITQINDGVSYLLKYMPSLELIVYEDLDFVLSNIYKHDVLKASEDKYNLTSFTIPFSFLSKRLSPLQGAFCILSMCCPFIKVLSVPIEIEQDLESISKLSGLEDFSASDNSPNHDLDLNWFLKQKGGALKRIEIRQFSMSINHLVESCPNLESFTFEATNFNLSNPNTNLKRLNNLYELHVKCVLYNDMSKQAVINILNFSPKLESLSFCHSDLKFPKEFSTELTKYLENSNLCTLKFYTCGIYVTMLETILLTCSSLKTLVLFQCHDIDSNNMEVLYKVSPSLKNKVEISCKDHKREDNCFSFFRDVYSCVPLYDKDYSHYDENQYLVWGR
ncbi:uncharacterized protein TNIN_412411 [Trichonephila inaurata madagascariensis]|uniref:Uncharacterized protein n=1 Tax=Trichonephila inaurata madagascariensis TaxID=2747483 RepID=A0A8X6XBA8_9ARAC|nr:uncharacterized protein TNIN_412411 [Trichonephila inaurata madagascariensis]